MTHVCIGSLVGKLFKDRHWDKILNAACIVTSLPMSETLSNTNVITLWNFLVIKIYTVFLLRLSLLLFCSLTSLSSLAF